METQRSLVELARMLPACRDGDASALERLTPIVYAQVHRIVRRSRRANARGMCCSPLLWSMKRSRDCSAKRRSNVPAAAISFGFSAAGNLPASQSDLIDLDRAQLEARQATLSLSEPTVVRDWRVARAWLYGRLESAKERRASAP